MIVGLSVVVLLLGLVILLGAIRNRKTGKSGFMISAELLAGVLCKSAAALVAIATVIDESPGRFSKAFAAQAAQHCASCPVEVRSE